MRRRETVSFALNLGISYIHSQCKYNLFCSYRATSELLLFCRSDFCSVDYLDIKIGLIRSISSLIGTLVGIFS